MKVYYDYQALCSQPYGGISRYFFELITRLKLLGEVDPTIKCLFSENKYFENLMGKKAIPRYHWRIGREIKRINKLYAGHNLKGISDIIHPTGYDPYIFDYKGESQKVVVTIHDMTQEKFSDSFYKGDAVIAQKKRQIYESDHIIAVSNNTKKDITDVYPDIAEEKITVIYHGNTILDQSQPDERFIRKIPNRYILYVGNRYTYKNFSGFVKGMEPILNDCRDLAVVCAGGGRFRRNELEWTGSNTSRYMQLNVTDNELAYLYRHAVCFVFPSLYEGFGMPILEAFSCGCPAVLSNTSSMPEIGGEGAVYFDPYDTQDLSDNVRRVINDNGLQGDLKEHGKARTMAFDWNTTARQVYKCYAGIL